MSKKIIAVGLDLGNSEVKYFSDVHPNGKIMPNKIALAENVPSGDNPIWDEYDGGLNVYRSSIDSEREYVWGSEVLTVPNAIDTYILTNRYTDKYYQLLVEFAITDAIYTDEIEDKVIQVVLITGCPSEEKESLSIQKNIERCFTGRRTVTRNGKEITFEVKLSKETFGVMAQPTATVTSLYFNETATKVARPDLREVNGRKAKIAVIDIGGGSVDYDILTGLRPDLSKRKTIEGRSMNYIYSEIAKLIRKEKTELKVDSDKIKKEIEKQGTVKFAGEQNNSEVIGSLVNAGDVYCYGKNMLDLRPYKKKVYTEVVDYLISQISPVWNDRFEYDAILVTGGGANELNKYFTNWDKKCEKVMGSQQANAKGYYITAQMKKRIIEAGG